MKKGCFKSLLNQIYFWPNSLHCLSLNRVRTVHSPTSWLILFTYFLPDVISDEEDVMLQITVSLKAVTVWQCWNHYLFWLNLAETNQDNVNIFWLFMVYFQDLNFFKIFMATLAMLSLFSIMKQYYRVRQ